MIRFLCDSGLWEGICEVERLAFLTLRNSFMFVFGCCQGSLFMGDISGALGDYFPPLFFLPLLLLKDCCGREVV